MPAKPPGTTDASPEADNRRDAVGGYDRTA